MKHKTLYDVYRAIMQACYNEKSILYHSFGAKGIKVCPEWHDRDAFYNWCKENNWKPGMKVSRRNKEQDYCPDNCYIELFSLCCIWR